MMSPSDANTLLRTLAAALSRDGTVTLATCVELGLATGDKVAEAWAVATNWMDMREIASLFGYRKGKHDMLACCEYGCDRGTHCDACADKMRWFMSDAGVCTADVMRVGRSECG